MAYSEKKPESQTLIIDGCKVTVNYSPTSAIEVLSEIKKNLLSQHAAKK